MLDMLLVWSFCVVGLVIAVLALVALCESIPLDGGCGNVGDEE